MIQLRPYQSDILNRVYQSYQSGNRNVLVQLATGGGKSLIVSQIILDGHQQGLTEVVIAHRNELVSQMSMHVARRGIPHRIIASKSSVSQITAEHRREFGRSFVNPDARCSVVSVDTLVARTDTLTQWAQQVQRWTIDECFPAGTMIQTPEGEQPIETLKVGDEVIAFDERTGTFHSRPVTHTFVNPAPEEMVRIDSGSHHVITTRNHPFWTARGWVEAGNLEGGDDILVDMRGVRQGLHDRQRACELQCEEAWSCLLHSCVRLSSPGSHEMGRKVVVGTEKTPQAETSAYHRPGSASQAQGTETLPCMLCDARATNSDVFFSLREDSCIEYNGTHKSKIRFRSDDRTQSDASSRDKKQSQFDIASDETQTACSGWERQRFACRREGTDSGFVSVRICPAVCDTNGCSSRYGLPDMLQTGHGAPRAEDRCGSGWSLARIGRSQSAGREERHVFAMQRLDRVEVHKRADNDGCSIGSVYNIEVDEFHTYVANGIVVHNCHHVLRANKWGKAISMFPNAYGLGVTATPSRADGMGLGVLHDGHFHDMIVGPTMRDLIDMGALCDYEIACPESDLLVDDEDFSSSGDLSPKKGRLASQKSHIVGDVVAEYLKRSAGKRAICFATDVETAGEMAQRFNEAGVSAASVSAKTPSDVRNDMIRRFRDGRIQVLVNVDLFSEGFDVPSVETVIMARPTASLAVFLQQVGRALRPLEGKPCGLIIDHVSNWKRHGLPDRPRLWTLDRRDKRSKREPDPDDIPLTACRSCSRPYERCLPACPYCGEAPPVPEGGARSIEQVDGDLMLLDRATLAAMRAAMQLEAPGDVAERVGAVAGPVAAAGAVNRQMERYASQERLRQSIEQWAGVRRAAGEDDRIIAKRFYLTTGVDVLSAMTGKRAEMESLANVVDGWINSYLQRLQ